MSRQRIAKFTILLFPKSGPFKYICCLNKDVVEQSRSVQMERVFYACIYIEFKIFISISKSHYRILGNYRKVERRNPEITSNNTVNSCLVI